MPSSPRALFLASLLLASTGLAAPHETGAPRYARSVHRYVLPPISLLDSQGRRVSLSEVLPPGEPVALNFVYTSCTTICPVLSATFQSLRAKLGSRARFVSISIDPENDRPDTLRAYAARFHGGADWHLYTGRAEDIRALLIAFDAFSGDKANHRPLTFLRSDGAEDWVRVDGFASASALAAELGVER